MVICQSEKWTPSILYGYVICHSPFISTSTFGKLCIDLNYTNHENMTKASLDIYRSSEKETQLFEYIKEERRFT